MGKSEYSTLKSLITIAIVIAALYLGKQVLVPFALALLLSFVLTPAVVLLERLRFGRIASVLIVLTLAVSGIVAILWLGTTQLTDIIANLPIYQQNIAKKIQAMRNPAGYGLSKATGSIEQLSRMLTQEPKPAPVQPPLPPAKGSRRSASSPIKPQDVITVELKQPAPGFLDSLETVGTPVLHALEEAGAVLIFTLFLLLQRSDLRDRLFRLFGEQHLNVMTTAMDDAAQRVSRYLLTQSIINAMFGLVLGLGLQFLGVPNASFWGVLGGLLRFIPYLGTLVAGLCPLILALAVFDGWTKPLSTLGLFATVELLISAGLEPFLYGAHTGVSSLAILVSAAFWTLIWGPIGLILSTPLTVCLVVMGRYAPPVRFLGLMLGDEPVLAPEACFYQRLLAMDEAEAEEVAEQYAKENGLSALFDNVFIPALSLAEQDRHEDALDAKRESFVYRTTRSLIEEISEQSRTSTEKQQKVEQPVAPISILCVPARDEADELACAMLSQLLCNSGFQSATVPVGPLPDLIATVRERKPNILFVSALPPFGLSQTKLLCRKLRPVFPGMQIVVGVWDPASNTEKLRERLGADCFDSLVISLNQAEEHVRSYSEANLRAVEISGAFSQASSACQQAIRARPPQRFAPICPSECRRLRVHDKRSVWPH